MASLSLPVDLSNGKYTRTASTPTEYWNLRGAGWTEVDGGGTATLSPQQKAARTRKANQEKAAAEGGEVQTDRPDEDIRAQAGDANDDE